MKYNSVQEMAEQVVSMLETGEMKSFGSYSYYDGRFREGERLVNRAEVYHYALQYFQEEFNEQA